MPLGLASLASDAYSFRKLEMYVQKEKRAKTVGSALISHTETFLTTRFKDLLPVVSFYRYKHLFYGLVSENCFVESGNKALEHCGIGPKPQDGLDRSTGKIVQHTQMTHEKRSIEAHRLVNKRYSHIAESPKKLQKKPPPELSHNYKVMNELSTDILFEKITMAMNEFNLKDNYKVYRVRDGTSTVLQSTHGDHSEASSALVIYVKYNQPQDGQFKHCHPVYRRTRVVTITELEINNTRHVCVKCSCEHFHTKFMACRHIYRILERLPTILDFLPCCFKTYEIRHSVDPEYTAQANRMMMWYLEQGGIILRGSISDIIPATLLTEDNDADFVNSLDVSIDTNKNSSLVDDNTRRPTIALGHHTDSMKSTLGTLSQDAYNSFHPIFSQITDQVMSKEAYDMVRDGIGGVLQSVIALNNQKRTTGDNLDAPTIQHGAELHSLPVVDKRKNKKRLVPHGSPSREYKKKKKKT